MEQPVTRSQAAEAVQSSISEQSDAAGSGSEGTAASGGEGGGGGTSPGIRRGGGAAAVSATRASAGGKPSEGGSSSDDEDDAAAGAQLGDDLLRQLAAGMAAALGPPRRNPMAAAQPRSAGEAGDETDMSDGSTSADGASGPDMEEDAAGGAAGADLLLAGAQITASGGAPLPFTLQFCVSQATLILQNTCDGRHRLGAPLEGRHIGPSVSLQSSLLKFRDARQASACMASVRSEHAS